MSIYYFLISDGNTKKEVGNYLNASLSSIEDFISVKMKALELLKQSDNFTKNKTYKVFLDNHGLYYYLSNKNTFYVTAVCKTSVFFKRDYLLYDLIKDIDHQNLRNLVDENDELSLIAKKCLTYSITQFQEKNPESKISSYVMDTYEHTKVESQPKYKIKVKKKPKLLEHNELEDIKEKADILQPIQTESVSENILSNRYQKSYDSTLKRIKIAKGIILFLGLIALIISLYYIFH